MTRMQKSLVIVGVVLFLVLIFAFLYVHRLATQALPDYTEDVHLQHLHYPVTIKRDSYGIPHILAKTEPDLYRATGFCMAQDRLWQMDLIRRATQGRLSEIFGKDLVNSDWLLRALQIPQKSHRVWEASDESVRTNLAAFADGVNQYLQSLEGRLPPEFAILGYEPEPWEPEHCINLIGYMAWDLTMPWNAEIALYKITRKLGPEMAGQLFPDLEHQTSVVYEDFAAGDSELRVRDLLLSAAEPLEELGITVFDGSNNWVISGDKSTTGKPIFANDMHLGLFIPGIWYQIYQSVEGQYTVTGLALPGQPFVVAGHNDHIAWGMTNVMVDDMDFFREKTDAQHPDQYEYLGKWKPMDIRREKIRTKEGETVEKILRFTHHGPVISDFKHLSDEVLTMQWTGNLFSNEVRSVYLLNKARNWDQFKDAVSTFNSVSQNIAYADIMGNIGIYCCAGVPVRKKGDGYHIVPGWTDEYEWDGIVPFDQLPHSFNPEKGYVSSANNRSVSPEASVQIPQWPAPNYRIDRIREMLNAKDKLGIEDIEAMHRDHLSLLARDFTPDFLSALDGLSDPTTQESKALEALRTWDYRYEPDQIAPSIFEQTYLELMQNLFLDEMGDDLYAEYIKVGYIPRFGMDYIRRHPDSPWVDNRDTEPHETWTDQVRAAFRSGVKRLAEQYGPDPDQWQWGNLHHFVLNHPMGKVAVLDKLFHLNRGPYSVGGTSHTVSPFRYRYTSPFDSDYGSSHRHIYSTANWDDSKTVIPTGESGIPASPFYCNQTDLYIAYRYHDDPFSFRRVDENVLYTQQLLPMK
ncbi:MAG: penicillin acylase family protein [Candidatus Neomarinimicrobiota bacterium]|nr:MAG: penicillin acylase family protein [Candidatus Neomarinimicrobiota bacterium]